MLLTRSTKFLTAIPKPPPITTKIVPPVTANALAAINSSFLTNKGNPADKPAKINRLTPNASSTKKVSNKPLTPLLTSAAIINKFVARKKLALRIIRWRENRSKKVPT